MSLLSSSKNVESSDLIANIKNLESSVDQIHAAYKAAYKKNNIVNSELLERTNNIIEQAINSFTHWCRKIENMALICNFKKKWIEIKQNLAEGKECDELFESFTNMLNKINSVSNETMSGVTRIFLSPSPYDVDKRYSQISPRVSTSSEPNDVDKKYKQIYQRASSF